MEGGDQNIGGAGARWNPTKEQINMLENLYKQGLRTPSAEQIHQITVRLKAFGHIEGKNVFYWFQNHKARQRQKQKQENVAYFNRFLQPTPVFPSSYQNVVCSPCYMPLPQNHLGGLYQQYPKVPLPEAGGVYKRRLIPEISMEYNKVMHKNEELQSIKQTYDNHQETLDLFPMHPTGILQAKNKNIHHDTESDCSTSTPSSSENNCYNISGVNDGNNSHPFFDFFYGN